MAASNRIIGARIVNRAPRRGAGAPAAVIAFPIARQRDVITKIARAMMRKRSAKAADQCIGKALRRLMNVLRRQGIPAATIRREVHAMEAQVRGAAWRFLFPWIETSDDDGEKSTAIAARISQINLSFHGEMINDRRRSRCRASRG